MTLQTVYTVIEFGPREFMRYRGYTTEGELEFVPADPPRVYIREIQAAVAAEFEIALRDMTSDRRAQDVARPRQVAMHLAKKLTSNSLPEIGRHFGGRDHTTVIHADRQVQKRMAEDSALRGKVRALEALLTNHRQVAELRRRLGG